MEALKRYAQFYNLTVRDEYEKEDIAAMVARHFDCSLEVEEDDSIVSFIQRIRNGERNANKRTLSDKERKNNEKKRKKSASRKRHRDASTAAGSVASNGGGNAAASNGKDSGSSGGSGSGSSSGGREVKESGHGAAEERKSSASSLSTSGSSSSSNSHKKKTSSSKKDNDNGEDNELYCICNLPSYGNMIACDGKKCPNPSQWYHLECVGFSDGRHPDTWLCPECDPKGFAAFQSKKKKSNNKPRSKSPGSSK